MSQFCHKVDAMNVIKTNDNIIRSEASSQLLWHLTCHYSTKCWCKKTRQLHWASASYKRPSCCPSILRKLRGGSTCKGTSHLPILAKIRQVRSCAPSRSKYTALAEATEPCSYENPTSLSHDQRLRRTSSLSTGAAIIGCGRALSLAHWTYNTWGPCYYP